MLGLAMQIKSLATCGRLASCGDVHAVVKSFGLYCGQLVITHLSSRRDARHRDHNVRTSKAHMVHRGASGAVQKSFWMADGLPEHNQSCEAD